MKRMPIPTIITALMLVVIFLTYAFTFRVRFSEVALRVHLGKADQASVITAPGIYFRWCAPIEQVVTYDKRIKLLDTPEIETKTRDGKNLVVGCFALWKIVDPLKFYVSVVTEPEAEDQIRKRINEARQTVIGNRDLSSFVGLDEERVRQGYQEMEAAMLTHAAPAIRDTYGIELLSIGIRRLSLPESVTEKVFEQMTQEREALATRYREEGRGLARAIEARADSQAKQILAFAARKATEIESEGVRASARILNQIDPKYRDFFILLRQLDTIRETLREQSTIFFDAQGELFKLFTTPPAAGQGAAPAAGG
ncbi:MAG: Modulator of FtsH protease HflC [Phycisphaerae bacterium]|nr:Modulator of FtsH protease HflC [Phycisphaerae bacterium]